MVSHLKAREALVVFVVLSSVATEDLESRLRDMVISTWSTADAGDLISRIHAQRDRSQGVPDDLQQAQVPSGDLGRPRGVPDHLVQAQSARGDFRRPHDVLGIVRRPHDIPGDLGLPQSNGGDLERPLYVHDDLPRRPLSTNGDSGILQVTDGDLRRSWDADDGLRRPQEAQNDRKRSRSRPGGLRVLPGKRGDQRWHDLYPDIWYDPEYAANHRWEDEGYSSTTSTEVTRRTFDNYVISNINHGHSNIHNGINNINFSSSTHGINDHSNTNHGINNHSNKQGYNKHINMYDQNNNAHGNRGAMIHERHRASEQPKHFTQNRPQTSNSAPANRTPWLSPDMLIEPLGHLSMLVSALTVLFMIFYAAGVDAGSPADRAVVPPELQARELESIFHRIRDLMLPGATILKVAQDAGDGKNRLRRSSLIASRRADGEVPVFIDRRNHIRAAGNMASDIRTLDHRASDIRTGDHRASDIRTGDHRASDIRTGDHRASDIRTSVSGTSDIPKGDNAMADIRADDLKVREFETGEHGVGRQINPLSQIALSAAMVLGAYAGYAFINSKKPVSAENYNDAKTKTSINKNEEEIEEGFVMGDGSEESLTIYPVPSSVSHSSIHLGDIKNLTLPKLSNDRLMSQFVSHDDDNPISHLLLEVNSSKIPMNVEPRLNVSVQNLQTTQSSASFSYFLPLQPDLPNPGRLGKPAQAATMLLSDSDLSSGVFPTSGSFLIDSTLGPSISGNGAEVEATSGIKDPPTSVLVMPDLTPHLTPIATSNSGVQEPPDFLSVAAWDKAILPPRSASHIHDATNPPCVNLHSNIHHTQHTGTTHSDQHEYDKPPFTFWTRIARPDKQQGPSAEVLPTIEASETYLKLSTPKLKGNNHLISDSFPARPAETYETSTWVQNKYDDDDRYDHESDYDDSKGDRPEIYLITALPDHVTRQPSLEPISADRYSTPKYHLTRTYTPDTQLHAQPLVVTHTPSKGYTSQSPTESSTLAQNVFKYSIPLRVIGHQTGSGNEATEEENVSPSHFHSSSGSFKIYHRFPEPPQDNQHPASQSPHQKASPNNDDFEYDEDDALDAQTFNTLLKLARLEWDSLKSYQGNLQQQGSSYKKSGSASGSYSSANHHEKGTSEVLNTMISSEYSQGGPRGDSSSLPGRKESVQENNTTLPAELLNPVTLARLYQFLHKLLTNLDTTTPLDRLVVPKDMIPDEANRNSKSSRAINEVDKSLKYNVLLKIFSKISAWKNRRPGSDLDIFATDRTGHRSSDLMASAGIDYLDHRPQTLSTPWQVSSRGDASRSKAAGDASWKDRAQAHHVPGDGFQGTADMSTVNVEESLHRYVTTPVGQPATWMTLHDLSTWSSVSEYSRSFPEDDPGMIHLQNRGSTWLDGGPQSSFSPSLDLDDVGSHKTLSQSPVVPYVGIRVTSRSDELASSSVTKTGLGSSRPWIRSSKYRAEASSSVAGDGNLRLRVDTARDEPQRPAQTGSSSGSRWMPEGDTEIRVNLTPSAAYISDTPPGISSEIAHNHTHSFSGSTELSSLNPSIVDWKNEDTSITEVETTWNPFVTPLQGRVTLLPDKQMDNKIKKPTFGFGLERRIHLISAPGIPQKLATDAPSHIIIPAIIPQDSYSPNFQSFYLPDPAKYSAPKSWSASSSSSFSESDVPSLALSQNSALHSFQYSHTPPSSFKSSYPTRSTTLINKSNSSFRFPTEAHPAMLTSHSRTSSEYNRRNIANLPTTLVPPTKGLTSTLQDAIPTTIPSGDFLENFTSPPKDSVSLMSMFLCRHAVHHRACTMCMEEAGHRSECLVRMPWTRTDGRAAV